MYQGLSKIITNSEVMPGVHLIWVECLDITSAARPGQFVMIGSDDSGQRLLRRPISIHQVNSTSLAFLVASVGAGTEWLAQHQPGEKIDLLGPMGNGFSLAPESGNLLLIAGGIGIAPLSFLAQHAIDKGNKVKLLVGARTACQICPEQLLPVGCDIVNATEDGTAGEKGLVTMLIPQYLDWADQVFICGPLPMFKAVARDGLSAFRNKPVQVSLEVRMGCGLGFCYACSILTRKGLKQVCKDGPVFNMLDVIWDELK